MELKLGGLIDYTHALLLGEIHDDRARLAQFMSHSSIDVIMTSFIFFIYIVISKGSYSSRSQGKRLCAEGNNYAAPDCDTSDSDLLVIFNHKMKTHGK